MNTPQEFSGWHIKLLPGFISNIQENITTRLDRVEQVVNLNLPSCFDQFTIKETERDEIMIKVKPEITQKTQVQIDQCTLKITKLTEYKTVARNRLNRSKPKFLGNFVFGDIIFNNLYQFICVQGKVHNVGDISIMKLFLTTLVALFEENVRFERTKPQPLIQYRSVVDENIFKRGCIQLLRIYNVNPTVYEIDRNQPRDAKQATLKIVNAIKSINNDEILRQTPLPPMIIATHDSITNRGYSRTAINPPRISPNDLINRDNNNTHLRPTIQPNNISNNGINNDLSSITTPNILNNGEVSRDYNSNELPPMIEPTISNTSNISNILNSPSTDESFGHYPSTIISNNGVTINNGPYTHFVGDYVNNNNNLRVGDYFDVIPPSPLQYQPSIHHTHAFNDNATQNIDAPNTNSLNDNTFSVGDLGTVNSSNNNFNFNFRFNDNDTVPPPYYVPSTIYTLDPPNTNNMILSPHYGPVHSVTNSVSSARYGPFQRQINGNYYHQTQIDHSPKLDAICTVTTYYN